MSIGEITVITNDIFSPDEVDGAEGVLRFLRQGMNTVHVTTRDHVIRRELLFRTGEAYVPDRLSETERNLRELGYLNNVSVTAVDTNAAGQVAVLVTTREAWTLRTSFAYSRASGGDQRWTVQGSETNFVGYGVTAGAGLGADENAPYWNLWYRQRRLFKADFWLGLDYSQRDDGHIRQLILNRPFYALDDSWGSEFRTWSHEFGQRFYVSNAGPAGLDPGRARSLYTTLDLREKGLEARLRWRCSPTGRGRVWRLGGGVDVLDRDYRSSLGAAELSDGRVVNLGWLEAEDQPYRRDQGVEANPFVWVQTLGRTWTKSRFIRQYGPVEDIPLDWALDLKVGPSGGAVGSTTGTGLARWHAEFSGERWTPFGSGFLVAQVSALGDAGPRAVQTYQYDALLGWIGHTGAEMSPWSTRVFAEYAQAGRLLGSRALRLGLDRGLRTLDFDGMAGDHLVRWNLEQGKALPGEILGLVRGGLAVFYSGGRAWWRGEDHEADDYRHEAGLGIRFGPTRSASAQIARIDLAWDLSGGGSPVVTAVTRGFF